DLSMVAIADLAGLTAAEFFHPMAGGAPPGGSWSQVVVGVTVALAVGAGCGAVNGLLIGGLRIPPILATLATSELFGGLAIAWTPIASTASATPDYGQSYILLSVVIAVLAGVDPNGGFGTVTGVVLATLCLVMIQAGFIGLGFSQFLYEIAQGGILIAVLSF